MKNIITIVAILVILSSPSTAVSKEGPTDDLIQMGAYVATDDIERSESFYTALFGRAPIIKLEHFIAFEVAGGIFAIADRQVYAAKSVSGSGSVPYIHSTDLAAVRNRIEAATGTDAPEIISEPGIKLVKVTDPDGQLVEFFTLAGP